jgi:hypothetical protein
MKLTFTKNGKDNQEIISRIIEFIINNNSKKTRTVDADNKEYFPFKEIESSKEPVIQRIGIAIIDIHDSRDPEKVTNTILQFYLGKHLALDDPNAIHMSENSTIEFDDNNKGFIITSEMGVRKVKVLGFENVEFE